MKRILTRLHRDERGMSLVFVATGLMAFLAATTLAIDVGMFMTARSQAQTSADSAALAGAIALGFDDYTNRSSAGPAVQNALEAARRNTVVRQPVNVTPADVTFPTGPGGADNRVHVSVYRTQGRGNAVPTLMGRYFGVASANISAEATAEAARAGAARCVKPFTIPDRWIERQTGSWDPGDTFNMYDNHNNLLANPDVYIGPSSSSYTGYNANRDKGMQLMIRAGTGNNINPSFYFSIAIGGITGGSEYDWNIANCNTTVMQINDLMLQEPGNMVGPTTSGMDLLIARDPNAYWDTTRNQVVSNFHPSPRVTILPVFDPVYYATGVTQGRYADLKITNFIGFFIESRSGNSVYGRITPVSGVLTNSPPMPGAFPVVIRLVE
jgi:putative Flp pilus-assembly TadE/G-like protein